MRPSLRPALRLAPLAFLIPACLPAATRADVPDPAYSVCTFPERLPPVRTPVTIPVTAATASGPSVDAEVTVEILVDSGNLAAGQAASAAAVTDLDGSATLEFPDGIRGEGTIRFRVRADGIQLCTSDPYRLFTGPKLALHAVPAAPGSPCQRESEVPCTGFVSAGALETGYNVYLMVANVEREDGLAGLSFGIDYQGGPGISPEDISWTLCTDGLQFEEYGARRWPEPGTSNQLTWLNCHPDAVPGYEDQGGQVVAGFFYVFAYGADVLQITPNYRHDAPELFIQDCSGQRVPFGESALGQAMFTTSGSESGYNPCTGEGIYTPLTPPPPPPPVEELPVAVLLHIAPPTGESPCQGPTSPDSVVTSAEVSADGTARYFVYLLASPTASGLKAIRGSIQYDQDTPEVHGLEVDSWHSCNSDLTFFRDGWPASGGGFTLTWEPCETQPLVVGGYFYVTAYGPSVMSIQEFPTSHEVEVGGCGWNTTQNVDPCRRGWVSFGQGALGSEVHGCNPVLTPCSAPTPVRPITWGRLKSRYRDSGNAAPGGGH